MTDTVEVDIATALNEHLSTMPGVWPTSYEGVKFKPPANQQYFRTQLIQGPTETRTVDSHEKRFFGVYQVSVVIGKDDGLFTALGPAGLVSRHFADLTKLETESGDLLIKGHPQIFGSLRGDLTLEVPIQIRYEIFAK